MYKNPLTVRMFQEFVSDYQSITSAHPENFSEKPYVFVDGNDYKLITNMVGILDKKKDEVFAVSMAGDGWMELLCFQET